MEQLLESFEKKIKEQESLFLLRTDRATEEEIDDLQALDDAVMDLENHVNTVKERATAELASIETIKAFRQEMGDYTRLLEHMLSHMPKHLPGNYQSDTKVLRDMTEKENAQPQHAQATNRIGKTSAPTSIAPRAKVGLKASSQKTKRKGVVDVVTPKNVPFLSMTDLDNVPKYMKGRLTQDKINGFVTILNQCIQEKYTLLAKPPAKLGNNSRQRYWGHKQSESSETHGKCFITEQDLKTSKVMLGQKDVKMDATSRSIIAILRHVGNVREVRGGGHVRFVVQ